MFDLLHLDFLRYSPKHTVKTHPVIKKAKNQVENGGLNEEE